MNKNSHLQVVVILYVVMFIMCVFLAQKVDELEENVTQLNQEVIELRIKYIQGK